MVVVTKESGSIQISVDLKPLNRNILQEVHLLPKVDNVLAQLSEAKVSCELDAKSGFWQIPLAKSSRLFTTFIIPSGATASISCLSASPVLLNISKKGCVR